MVNKLSRREFVKGAVMAVGTAVAAPAVLAERSPGDSLGVAIVGVGGMGGYSVDSALSERIVAICDIDEGNIASALKKIAENQPGRPVPAVYYDHRKMLKERQADIDVVLIATPDHHHAPAAIRAMHAGKAVFCQKPLARDIYEVHALMEAAKRNNVLTQMGNQGHCGESIRRACEYIWAGAIGNVTETYTVLGRNFGGSGGRLPTKPVPPGVHWDEWIGPSPYRDYHDNLHPFNWRSWKQFGTGTIGDMACHNLDALFWALHVAEAPHVTIECLSTTGGSEEMYPQNNVVRYEVPARGKMGPLKVHVYDNGDIRPDVVRQAEKDYDFQFGEGTLFIGDKGVFWTSGAAGSAMILPIEKHEAFPKPPKTLPRAHVEHDPIGDLFYCLKNGGTPCSNFPDSAGPLTSFALLGHLAQFAGVGKKLEWDVRKRHCKNIVEVNQYIRRKYRKGWEV